MLSVLVATALVAALALAAMAVRVWRVRGSIAGLALAVLLLAVAWWSLAYAGELTSSGLPLRSVWGDLKYLGICLLPPSLLVFVLDYTGRRGLVTRRLLAGLAVPPILVWLALAVPATHDLVRYYVDQPAGRPPLVGSGPVFWANLAYSNLLLLVATGLFVSAMVRLARTYKMRAALLIVAALLPWAANLLFNFGVGVFTRIDLTPFAFVLTGAALVHGLFLSPTTSLSTVAWQRVVRTMTDGVVLVDPFGWVVDANPAAGRILGAGASGLRGRHVEELLPERSTLEIDGRPAGAWQTTVHVGDRLRHLDVERQLLTDSAGAAEGELVLLRDVTEREEHQREVQALLAERTRIAATLTSSLLPAQLPSIEGVELASRYLPAAAAGSEVGGDFFDVFPLGRKRFGFVLGDVSGKGAPAAAVTGLVRYTLRALATPGTRPAEALRRVNRALLRASDEERYCTLVYGIGERAGADLHIRMCLAGHHRPVIRRAGGGVLEYGALGSALGLLGDPELHDTELLLRPGDLFCLYTDGLIEARSGDDWFGSRRMREVLRRSVDDTADAMAARLVAAVESFQPDPLADDLALLAIRPLRPNPFSRKVEVEAVGSA